MKLDATDLRYVTSDEFRVLTAVEMGSKNHEVVPTSLIVQISGLRNGGVNKMIGSLAKRNLVSKVQNSKYDGYRLTYGGYDYLAMRALSKRDSMYSVGNQIGVGKESDIYIVADLEGNEMVLKLHRLGRVSFRAIKEKRDYMGKRKSASWMYMSRLAAQKEWAFMKVLYEHDFPVPRPIDQARHTILMEYIDAYPLRQIDEVASPGELYSKLMDVIVRFARAGLIHGDYNEFNILIRRDTGEPVVIDFPQMVSTSHENAEWYFNRDVECIRTFFRRRFKYESKIYPRFRTILKEGDGETDFQLDVVVEASGFGRREMKVLQEYMDAVKEQEEPDDDSDDSADDESSEDQDGEVAGDHEAGDVDGSGSLGDDEERLDDIRGQPERATGTAEHPPSPSLNESHLSIISPSGEPSEPLHPQEPSSAPQSEDRTTSLEEQTASLSLSEDDPDLITDRAITQASKAHARQQRKYHSKKGAQRVGRPKGSKAKQDTRVKLDRGGMWD